MKLPLQITTRNVSLSETAIDAIRDKAAKLETFYDRIISCRVLVEAPHRHKHQGVAFNVRIDITVPGHEIVVKREPNEDVYIAIRDSFDAARRQLQDVTRRQRGEKKIHEPSPVGHIRRLSPEGDHGFIETSDGREIYFHRNSVRGNGGFDHLAPDLEVRFVEEQGEQGPQATVVLPLGK